MKQQEQTVAIIGAGPAGLAAAWRVAEMGDTPVVFEQGMRVGGLGGTVERNGFRFDFGGHRFITADPELLARVRAICGSSLKLRRRQSAIRFQDRFIEYPLQPFNLLRRMGFGFALRGLLSKVVTSAKPDGSFEGWARSTFGQFLAERFFLPYTEKLWGIPPAELDDDFAAARIPGLDLAAVVLSMLGRRRQRTFAARYLYPDGGMGRLFERIASEVERLGGVIKMQSRVTGIQLKSGAVSSLTYLRDAQEHSQICDRIIATTPITSLPTLLTQEELPAPGLRFRGLRFLNFGFEGADFSPYTWIYVPDRSVPFTRVQEPRRRSIANAPTGMTSLMLEIPADPESDLWSASDRSLFEESRAYLDRIAKEQGRVPIPEPELLFSVRARHAYPILERGYRKRREAFLRRISKVEGLFLAGRQATFRYIFMDAAMQQGMNAAEAISPGDRSAKGLIESGSLLG